MHNALVGSALALLPSSVVALALMRGAQVRVLVAFVFAMGAALLAVAYFRPGTVRLRGVILVAVHGVVVLAVMILAGWVPAFVGLSLLFVALVGLVVGHRAAYVAGAVVVLALFLGGLAVDRGVLFLPPSELDPTVPLHWVRVGVITAAVAAAMSYLLRLAMTAARESHARARDSLAAAEKEAHRVEESRLQREAEERRLLLAQKQGTVRQLAGGLGHHVNNLLMVTRLALDQAARASDVESVRAAGRLVSDTIEQDSGVLRDLMLFSRKSSVQVSRLEVAGQLEGLHEALRSSLRDDQDLRVEAAENLWVTLAHDAFRQLLMELTLNALDALPQGGEVQVSARLEHVEGSPEGILGELRPGPHVVIRVRDAGVGMDADILRRAPTAFFTSKEQSRHPGLGLSTAFGIARSAGGAMALRSAAGAGTEVTVWLAYAADSEGEQPVPVPSPNGHIGQTPCTSKEPPSAIRPEAHPSHGADVQVADLDPESAVVKAPLPVEDEKSFRNLLATREDRIVRHLLMLVCVCLLVGSVVLLTAGSMAVIWAPIAATLVALWGLPRKRSPRTRAVVLLGCVLFPFMCALPLQSYLGPGVVAMLYLVVSLAAVVGNRRILTVCIGLVVVAFVASAVIFTTGVQSIDLQPYSQSRADNWYRVAAILGLFYVLLAASVVQLVQRARDGVVALQAAQLRQTERQAAREQEVLRLAEARQLAAASEELQVSGQLAGAVAHDLKNGLHRIMLVAYELETFDPPHSEDSLQTTLAPTLRLLEDSLSYSAALVAQLDVDGTQDPGSDKEIIDLSEVVGRTLGHLEAGLGSRVRLRQTLSPHLRIAAPPRDVERIVMNLVQNAQHAMPDGGELTVRVSTGSGMGTDFAELLVEDTGQGMDAATRASAFDAFFTTKEAGTGTGLGLTAVRDAAARTHGRVSLHSTPGVGTTVGITWDRQSVARESTTPEVSPAAEPVTGDRHTVLVAEDHAVVRKLLERALSQAGYSVLVAEDGDVAGRLIAERPDIDLLLVDGVMPGRSTRSLIESFRARERRRPVVLCSGHLPDELQRWGVLAEDIVFLSKPAPTGEILENLQRLLR